MSSRRKRSTKRKLSYCVLTAMLPFLLLAFCIMPWGPMVVGAIPVLIGLCWSVAWVVTGRSTSWRWRPFVDAAIVNLVAGGALLIRFAYTREFLLVGLLLGWLGSVVCIGMLWMLMGSSRPASRLPWFLLALAAAWGVLILSGRDFVYVELDAVIVAMTLIVFLWVVLSLLRSAGLKVVNQHWRVDSLREKTTRMTTRDILWTTVATAVLVFVGRVGHGYSINLVAVLCLVGYATGAAMSGLCCIWLALGNHWLSLRVLLATASVPAVAYSTRLGARYILVNQVTWYLASCALAAVLVAGALLIFRMHGYRLSYSRSAPRNAISA